MAAALALRPRLVVAAPYGRSGKTTVSLGLCAAMAARGLAVQPFKKGPDYIDPSWLSHAAGRPCRSLDPVLLGSDDAVRVAFERGARNATLSVVEGNHGLFDSASPSGAEDGSTSTAAVARLLAAPILLVVNAARMGRSAAALVHGYQTFEPGTPLAGVILNNVAHARHAARLRAAIEAHCGLPVLGSLPRDAALTIPDRHLGLIPKGEDDGLLPAVAACRAAAERYLDLGAILALARSAPALPEPAQTANLGVAATGAPVTIGIVRDRAFSFYYPENLEALERAGAKLAFVDALADSQLPPVGALYIGGGFPELFLAELEGNTSLRHAIRSAIEQGQPVYAECGGLMYLSQRIRWGERAAEMVGALPCSVELVGQPQGHGYVVATAEAGNPFLPPGTRLLGHEFHHSRLASLPGGITTGYCLERGSGLGGGRDGLVIHNVLAAYTHLHADGAPDWAPGVVAAARRFAAT